jgi:hypothetical protein
MLYGRITGGVGPGYVADIVPPRFEMDLGNTEIPNPES